MSAPQPAVPPEEAEGHDVAGAARVTRRWPVVAASVGVVVVVVLGVIIALRPKEPFALDTEWMGEIVEHRSPLWLGPALFFNYAGGGIIGSFVVPLLIFLLLLAFRRPWGAAFFAIASIVSVALVQLLKHTVDRARPTEILVHADTGSFPSGHTANAATMVVVLGILFPRVWVWVIGVAWAVLMAASRTYLGAHWISDTVGGLILGAGVAVIVWTPLAHRLALEAIEPHPFFLARSARQ
ncbi:phosphatase PAP2 family protein [Leifsonia sp. fls2-241-R2A-40a]|uniref:phosphatase PAP2 family protein n=1 Tax=Leifsonia sp. fls2-241-R2A-40a TaxID=3040290 RepID=UPI002550907E|nr:phosphatase PAP2 family protein [Leifsonia sp. fls2-241-R2A-40a]